MRYAIAWVAAFVVLSGCLGFLQPAPTASPTATPVPTLAPTPTPQVIVTEKIVYVTVTPTPAPPTPTPVPPVRGGISVVQVFVENTTADVAKVGNADYHSNPFVSQVSQGTAFAGLTAGTYEWQGAPIVIAPDFKTSGAWSVLTTTDVGFYEVQVSMRNRYYSRLFVVLAARYGDRVNRSLADLILHYGDGSSTRVQLVSGKNVWNYDGPVPDAARFWQSAQGNESLSIMEIDATQPDVPLATVGFRKTNQDNDGIAVFAITGQRWLKEKKLLLTPDELDNPENVRELAAVDSLGVHLTPREVMGKSVYPPQGVLTLPVKDAETVLANFSSADWVLERPAGTTLTVEARVGPRRVPDIDWTDWFPLSQGKPLAHSARYYQLRFTLTTADSGLTPLLKQFELHYINPA